MRATALTAVAAAAALAAALSACGGSGGNRRAGGTTSPGDATSSTAVAAPVVAAVEGLCVARSELESDAKSVRATFYDRSHEALHTIARQLDPVDRGLAARLLEAKEAVEVDVSAQPPAPSLGVDLDHLIDAARQGLARLSIPFAGCR